MKEEAHVNRRTAEYYYFFSPAFYILAAFLFWFGFHVAVEAGSADSVGGVTVDLRSWRDEKFFDKVMIKTLRKRGEGIIDHDAWK